MTPPRAIGQHLLADFYGVPAPLLSDAEHVRAQLLSAAAALHVTVLGAHLHHFGEGLGVTGVLLLAESHMSIHTWPESGYAALDVFTCGPTAPEAAVDVLVRGWNPARLHTQTLPRGQALQTPD